MTKQEYDESYGSVREYQKCDSLLKKLKEEQSRINCGILEITTFCQEEISCYDRGLFLTRLKDALMKFYDGEIEAVRKDMENI